MISDADEELLFNIPFTGNVKLKGLIVMGGEDGTHPAKVRLFKNRPHMTFDMAPVLFEMTPHNPWMILSHLLDVPNKFPSRAHHSSSPTACVFSVLVQE